MEIYARELRDPKVPFGGIQVNILTLDRFNQLINICTKLIVSGDFYQPRPHWTKKFCFQAHSWKFCFGSNEYKLTTNFRHQEKG